MSLDFKNLLGASEGSGIGQQAAQSAMGIDGGCFPSLTFKQRIIGFGCCFTLGMVITFLSTLSLMNPVQFAVLYTFGNIVSLFSTAFLFGPLRQLKNMFQLKRITATLLYIAALIGTLVVAFVVKNVIAVLFMILIQFLALVWYTLSYIPYARDCAKAACAKCFTR